MRLLVLLLASTLVAAPPHSWPGRGVDVADDVRRVMGDARVAIGPNYYGTCAALTGAVVAAAEADGLRARALVWDVPDGDSELDERHVTPLVQLPDGRWCGFDYWDHGVRYRCSEDARTDRGWWNRVTCCRPGMRYLEDASRATLEVYRRALEIRRDPGYAAALRAHRRMVIDRRGREP